MRWLSSVLLVAATTGLASAGRHFLALPDVEMLYLLGIVVAALWLGRGPAVLASALSVAAYDFFFVLPHHTFRVDDVRFLLTFVMMIAIGLLVSSLVERLRRQEQEAAVRESRAALLSAVSHDLRTPLAAITGAASTVRDEPGLDDATRRELLQDVCDEAERLERLVGNLLDMTRLEGGKLQVVRPEWVPAEELVGAALARVEGRLAGRPVTASIAPDLPLVPCDPVLLQHLLINLLDNAAKYTPPGSPLEIAARPAEGAVVLEVLDRGPGLPARGPDLFEPFARGDHPEVPGAGLGLAICRGIAHAHGGTLRAEPREGGGARFRLTIPLRGAPPRVAVGEAA